MGGAILYTDSTHIKAKANKHKKRLAEVAETPKAYMKELDAQVDRDRKAIGKKPFDHDDDDHKGSETTKRMESTTDPESGQQSRDGKPDGFHYSEHRTVDSLHNVIVNVHVEPANINDITPLPEILSEIEQRLGKLPKYMGLDAGCHGAWIAHLLETKGIEGVIGYRRHTHKTNTYGKSTDSAITGSTTFIPALSITGCTGKPPRAKAIVNTAVIQQRVRNAPDEQSALARV